MLELRQCELCDAQTITSWLKNEYAFDELKADKVTLGVFENNVPAIQCYLSCGFQIVEKEIPESYQCMGETWNCVEMEVINSFK